MAADSRVLEYYELLSLIKNLSHWTQWKIYEVKSVSHHGILQLLVLRQTGAAVF